MPGLTRDFAVLEVIRVVDGDTVDLRVDLGFHCSSVQRFRLLDIDTPERGEPGWAEARDYVRTWLAEPGRRLRVASFKTDSFGRWLGDVYDEVTGHALYIALLMEGLAVHYVRKP